MKQCFKCGENKPLDEFYKHPMMGDGHLNKCKECAKVDVRANREARREHYLAYDRARTPLKVATVKASQRRHRDRHLARVAIQNAVKRGKVMRQPCSVCGDPKSQAHHDDYSKRLDVTWLCRKHHSERHRIPTGERGVRDKYVQRSVRAGTLPMPF